MELLIPGLILVALMVWASTKIKKSAADAFQAELIETDAYSLQKPEGFLHVLGDPEHELRAYSKENGKQSTSGERQATIELDVIPDRDIATVRDAIEMAASRFEVRTESANVCELEADEAATESHVNAFYKIVKSGSSVYRLRFAVLSEHKDEYLRRIQETLDSFTVKAS